MENFTNSPGKKYMQDGKRLKEVRAQLGLSQKELADKIGLKYQKIADIECGRVKLPVEVADYLYVNFYIDFRWLLTGKETLKKVATIQPTTTAAIKETEGEDFIQPEGGNSDYLFNRKWVNQQISHPKNSLLVTMNGNYMEPSLKDGDNVMIDTGDVSIYEGGIFAVRINGTFMIKRLSPRPGGKVKVISDNKEYDSYETAREGISVEGKVVWIGRVMTK